MSRQAKTGSGRSVWAKRTRTILHIALALFVIGGLFSGYVFYSTVRALVAEADISLLPNLNLFAPKPITVEQEQTNGDLPQIPVWQRTERVNILLLGADKRPDEAIYRTDTLIVLTLDPETKSAGMLSLPRDLWVPIPGHDESRINQAYVLGEVRKYPGGGTALAMRTVQEFLGIPIHGYVLVDFDGFIKLVDQIGGIDIEVAKEIHDTEYPTDDYGYQEVYIPAGLVHMDGDLALKYARVRHGSTDIDRGKRQQQVLLAARDKALRINLLPKLPSLMATIMGSVKTDLQPGEILALAKLANQVDTEQILSRVVDYTMVVDAKTPGGGEVLLPDREKIRAVVDELFTRPSENHKRIPGESAALEVLNGAGIPGLGAQMAALLKEQGFDVVTIDNADRSDYAETVIIDYAGNPQTTALLAQILNVSAKNTLTEIGSQTGPGNLRIIVGKDFALPSP
jgi:LCP family protein required for cell wall assembly